MSPILTPLPLAANAVIALGDMVCFDGRAPDGSGLLYVVPASDTAGLSPVIGQSQTAADNTGGADGDLSIHVLPGIFELTGSGLTLAKQNQMMFVTGAQTFASTSTNYIFCGRLVRYVSATDGFLDTARRPLRRAWEFRQPHAQVSHVGWLQWDCQPQINYTQHSIIRFISVQLAVAASGNDIGFCTMGTTCTSSVVHVDIGQSSAYINNLATFIAMGTQWYFGILNSQTGTDPIMTVEADVYDPVEAAQ